MALACWLAMIIMVRMKESRGQVINILNQLEGRRTGSMNPKMMHSHATKQWPCCCEVALSAQQNKQKRLFLHIGLPVSPSQRAPNSLLLVYNERVGFL